MAESERAEFQRIADDQGRLAELIQEIAPSAAESQQDAGDAEKVKSESELDRALQEAGISGFTISNAHASSTAGLDDAPGGPPETTRAVGEDVGAASSDEDVWSRIEQGMRTAKRRGLGNTSARWNAPAKSRHSKNAWTRNNWWGP